MRSVGTRYAIARRLTRNSMEQAIATRITPITPSSTPAKNIPTIQKSAHLRQPLTSVASPPTIMIINDKNI